MKHVVFIKQYGSYWSFGYINRVGHEETVHYFPETLREAQRRAHWLADEIYYGEKRRNQYPEEYPVEIHHVDGRPPILIAESMYSDRWLNDGNEDDSSKIIEMSINDAVRDAIKTTKHGQNMLWFIGTFGVIVPIMIALCRGFCG